MAQGIIEALRSDHDAVQDLFAQLETATGQERENLFRFLVAHLITHEVAEEEILRPISRRDAGKTVVEARLKEESRAEKLLSEMEKLDCSSEEFATKLTKLRSEVEKHAAAEESEEFPKVEKAQSPEQLERLGRAYEAAKMMAPTHPHPNTPNTPMANLLVGPFAAVMDRARDAVRDAVKAVS
jgi:iron-sulfur cluster repair protein YtfE (RIC family)